MTDCGVHSQTDVDDGLRVWRSFQMGKLMDLIILDTRNYDRSITDLCKYAEKGPVMNQHTDQLETGTNTTLARLRMTRAAR